VNYLINKIKIIFFGTADFALPSLQALVNDELFKIILVVTQSDKPSGRKQLLTVSPVKLLAKNFDLPISQPQKISEITFDLKKLNPDLIIVVAYAQILPEIILNLPKYGCLNVHGSLLPKYRGASPIQTALLNNDKQTGTTIIKMDKGLDTGAILAQSPLPILVNDNAGSLHDKLAKLSSQLLIPTIKKYLDGKIKPRPQDNNLASYAPKLKKSDGLINWNKTASENESFIRAMSPWPSAWTWWKGKQIKIVSVQHLPLEINSYKPGKIFIYNSGLVIQCGKDALIIKKLQLEGKKELSSEEFLRGQRDFIGTILT